MSEPALKNKSTQEKQANNIYLSAKIYVGTFDFGLDFFLFFSHFKEKLVELLLMSSGVIMAGEQAHMQASSSVENAQLT